MNKGFEYFPEKLYSKPVKMLSITARTFGMSKPVEIYYSIKDGNWSDITVWETVSGRNGKIPGAADDVYIRHAVALNVTTTINKLFITGTFSADNNTRTITITNDLRSTGIIDFTASDVTLNLQGFNNVITNFISGTTSTVTYSRVGTFKDAGSQPILNIPYRHLTISASGTKYATDNITVNGDLQCLSNGILQLGSYNLTVNGQTNCGSPNCSIWKNGAGNVLFVGRLTAGGANAGIAVDFTGGNPDVELRGGLTWGTNGFAYNILSGTGTWNFTTNNQTFTQAATSALIKMHNILISDITITNTSGGIEVTNTMNGTTGGSIFINGAGGCLMLNTANQLMTTGVLDITTNSTNSVGYAMTGAFTLWHTAYANLEILTSGTKVLAGNTTLSGKLNLGVSSVYFNYYNSTNSAILDLSTYDFTVIGIATCAGLLKKTGGGNVLFIGALRVGAANSPLSLDFRIGNPNVEVRTGCAFATNQGSTVCEGGTGTWNFTTNNQTWENPAVLGAAAAAARLYNVLISGAITINTSVNILEITNSLNGNNAASTFDNRGTVHHKAPTQPMITGVLQTNAAANTWLYDLAGNQDVTGGTYRTLTLAGSGAKKLQGNVVVATTYVLTAPATLDLNGFTRT